MRTIETTATVGPDGKLVLQLPPDVAPAHIGWFSFLKNNLLPMLSTRC